MIDMKTPSGYQIDTVIRAQAVEHAQGVTLTIEIPADELPRPGENYLGLAPGLIAMAIRAIETPAPGTLRMIRGGKA